MPGGGRGNFLDIAIKLNSSKSAEIAKAVKMAIDNEEYRISGMTISHLGDGFDICANASALTDVWCHAIQKHKVDWSDY